MNYHVFQNEPKFIGDFIEVSDSINQIEQCYIALSPSENLPWLGKAKTIKIYSETELISFLSENTISSDKIFFHSLTDEIIRLASIADIHAKIYWVVWGWELYENVSLRSINRYDFVHAWPNNYIYNHLIYYKSLVKTHTKKTKYFYHFLRKITSILHYNKYDIKILNNEFGLNLEMMPFFYKNVIDLNLLNKLAVEYTPNSSLPQKILLGNSATVSNNHFSMINTLSKLDEDCILYVPLSYGPIEYVERVKKFGYKKLSEKFKPVTDFMSPQNYLYFLNSIDVAIMNQIRSQAMGNIIVLLALEKTLYLNPYCTTAKFLDDLGINFFLTTDLKEGIKTFNKEVVKMNKEIIQKYFSNQAQVENMKNIYSI